jgi:hypothetical protein
LELVGRKISVTFFEIHGKKCYDLLQDRKEVALRADASERVHVRGALTVSEELSSAQDFIAILEGALRLRKSEATERNPISSRSHAVCILDIEGAGQLRFVDLAGSERNYETTSMSAKQHRDFVEINKSLMALKDCFRAHAQLARNRPGRAPYRASQLTQVLRSCFTDSQHRTVIVATVSPTATDLLHSTNSLLQVTQISTTLSTLKAECFVDLPIMDAFMASRPIWEWTTEEVDSWIKTVNGGRFKYLVLPPRVTGAMLLQLSSQGLADLFETSLRMARADGEGEAWNEAAHVVGSRIGRQLFAAVRAEALRWPGAAELLENMQAREAEVRQRMEAGHDLPAAADRHCEFFFWGETSRDGPQQQQQQQEEQGQHPAAVIQLLESGNGDAAAALAESMRNDGTTTGAAVGLASSLPTATGAASSDGSPPGRAAVEGYPSPTADWPGSGV